MIAETAGSVDETVQAYCLMLEAGRATDWRLGDLAAEAVARHGQGILSALASAEGVSTACVRQRVAVAQAFRVSDRRPDRSFTWYRALLLAAGRLQWLPRALLDAAGAADWSYADFAAMGKAPKPATVAKGLDTTCGGCGFRVRLTVHGRDLAGARDHGTARVPPLLQLGPAACEPRAAHVTRRRCPRNARTRSERPRAGGGPHPDPSPSLGCVVVTRTHRTARPSPNPRP